MLIRPENKIKLRYIFTRNYIQLPDVAEIKSGICGRAGKVDFLVLVVFSLIVLEFNDFSTLNLISVSSASESEDLINRAGSLYKI